MIQNRRTSPRFEIITVLEFKLGSKTYDTYFGISRNFSCEGLSLETQCTDFESGDSLDVRFKHPDQALTISVPGHVAWKRNAGKFATVMGIRLEETDLENRLRMLETMSAAGDIPVDSFFTDNIDADKETLHKEAPIKDSNPIQQGGSAPELPTKREKDITPEGTEKKELVQRYFDRASLNEKFLSTKFLIYASITAVIVMLIAVTSFLTIKNGKDDIKAPVKAPVNAPLETSQAIKEPAPDKPQVSKVPDVVKAKQEKPVVPRKTPTAIKPANKKANYVQVGAWSSKANARNMLVKVGKYYPEAYLDVGKNLSKVKIPVKDKAHGYKVLKDVKDKFKVNPLLMLDE